MTRSELAPLLAAVVVSCAILGSRPVFAQEPGGASPASVPQAAAAVDVDAALQEARECHKTGDYDRAIGVLRPAIQAGGQDPAKQQEAYLLLIKTYVFLGNDLKLKPQGREAANLNYKEARTLIGECLGIPALRRTRPEPATDYPPEMIDLFATVRAEMFGAFRIVGLEPADAVAILDADTLSAVPGEAAMGATDLPVGRHQVLVRRDGYKDFVEEIAISPNSTLERSYSLDKKHGKGWYAAIGTGVAAVTGVIVAIAATTGGSETAPQPLPGPPDPPNR